MKMLNLFRYLLLAMILLINARCSKEYSTAGGPGTGVPPGGTINRPPLAKAGSDQIVTLPANSTSLDGSGSTDPDNNISTYSWAKIGGPLSGNISNPTSMQTQVTNLTEGVYQFELIVTDVAGLSVKDTVAVDVRQPLVGQPPVALAGPDQTITLPLNSVALDGSASNDPDNNISSYQWRKVQGPAPGIIINANAVQTQVMGLVTGSYYFELKVTDAGGLSNADTVQVVVNPPASNQEVIFNDLTWVFPWYNAVAVPDFYTYVPQGTAFVVFIRRGNDTTWVEVPPMLWGGNQGGSYEYYIENRPDGGGMYSFGSLYIFYYGNDVSDRPDVKIKF